MSAPGSFYGPQLISYGPEPIGRTTVAIGYVRAKRKRSYSAGPRSLYKEVSLPENLKVYYSSVFAPIKLDPGRNKAVLEDIWSRPLIGSACRICGWDIFDTYARAKPGKLLNPRLCRPPVKRTRVKRVPQRLLRHPAGVGAEPGFLDVQGGKKPAVGVEVDRSGTS